MYMTQTLMVLFFTLSLRTISLHFYLKKKGITYIWRKLNNGWPGDPDKRVATILSMMTRQEKVGGKYHGHDSRVGASGAAII